MNLHTLPIEPDDLDAARAWESTLDGAEVRLLPDDAAVLTWIAGAALERGLDSMTKGDIEVAWLVHDASWPPVLELEDDRDNHRHGLVVVAPSSMEPRPTWPVTVPVEDLDAWEFDFVVSCYVPKRSTLEAPADTPGDRATLYAVGWMWADEARGLPLVHAEPHEGHAFHADYQQGKCELLRDLSTLASSVFAATEA